MSYAIRNDGRGWRAVNGPEDIGQDETFSETAPAIPALVKTQFTSLEFLDRFTEDEQLAVVSATMVSAPVKLWYDRLLAASFVDIADPRTEDGIDALISAGLLAANRKPALIQPEVL